MTANDKKALRLLARMECTRAGNFGQEMSSSTSIHRFPQAYARGGGKVLKRLVGLGYAEWFDESRVDGDWGWRITAAGRQAALVLAREATP